MEKLKQSLNLYSPSEQIEVAFKDAMLELLSSARELAFSRSNLEAHFTASAWILNTNKSAVLLLKHAKLDKWLQPGGHADGDMDLLNVAWKEAFEETGIKRLKLLEDRIFDIDIHEIPARKEVDTHLHYDVRYAFICQEEDEVQINHESKGFKWIKLIDLPTFTGNHSILRMGQKSIDL